MKYSNMTAPPMSMAGYKFLTQGLTAGVMYGYTIHSND